tara:strand:- start:984 stop:1376 length:393 start_codon:yes stop_codon:yes gene_type:complete
MSKQKEREKSFLVSELTSQSNEQRKLSTELQKTGISNWFDNLSKRNEEYKNSAQYRNDNEEERLKRISENSELDINEKDYFEQQGINLDDVLRRQLEGDDEDMGYGDGTDAADRDSDDDEDEDQINGIDD